MRTSFVAEISPSQHRPEPENTVPEELAAAEEHSFILCAFRRREALRRSIIALIGDDTRPKEWLPSAHPAIWAPFVIAGEGGKPAQQ
jgi:hypothetical protein